MAYTKIGWDGSKKLNDANLDQMDQGVKDANDAVDAMDPDGDGVVDKADRYDHNNQFSLSGNIMTSLVIAGNSNRKVQQIQVRVPAGKELKLLSVKVDILYSGGAPRLMINSSSLGQESGDINYSNYIVVDNTAGVSAITQALTIQISNDTDIAGDANIQSGTGWQLDFSIE